MIVHGGGPQVTQVSERLGIETTFVDGLRVTDAATLDVATMVLAGKLNTEVVAIARQRRRAGGRALRRRRRAAAGAAADGSRPRASWARSCTSTPSVLQTLTAQRFVPVVASIAVDETTGQAYNVNADVVASELAIALGAEKLVFINDVPGLIGPAGDLLSELSAEQCLDLLAPAGRGGRRHDPQAGERGPRLEGGGVASPPRRRPRRALVGPGTVHAGGRGHDDHARRRGGRCHMTTVPTRSATSALMPTYAPSPLTLVRGAGTRVWDEDGRAYLDFAGALGVTAIGHSHPAWVRAVQDQVGTLDLVSNLFTSKPQLAMAERLASLLPIPDAQVFFCNSGAEANEAAIKLARKHGLASGRPAIVALDGSFHGRTTATLAATGQPAKRAAFEPLVDWFRFVPPGDVAALDAALTLEVGALLLEPVMGEGGVHPLTADYLVAARGLCDERGVLMIADEVQSGVGRCGDWLAISASGVVPDFVTLAKALGGGLPIGALVTPARSAFAPGDHATTFGGGPIVCAGALAVLDVIESEGLLSRAFAIGRRRGDGGAGRLSGGKRPRRARARMPPRVPAHRARRERGRARDDRRGCPRERGGSRRDPVVATARGERRGGPRGRRRARPRPRGGPRSRSGRRTGMSNGASKSKRQQAIIGLVARERLASQEEIRARLSSLGIEATQSTISRDVEELGLARVHDHDGTRYVMPGEAGSHGPIALLRHLMDEFALSFVASSAGLIVRTSPGACRRVAEGIDRAGHGPGRRHDRRRQHDLDPGPGRRGSRTTWSGH